MAEGAPEIRLAPIDEAMIDRLVAVAVEDADPEDVMPPVDGGGPEWNDERVEAFKDYHRARLDGLASPNAEVGFAILAGGQVAGVARLGQVDDMTLEAGLWLGRTARGRGIGTAVLSALVVQAGYAGARVVVAETTIVNEGALGVLRNAGARIDAPDREGVVHAEIHLRSEPE